MGTKKTTEQNAQSNANSPKYIGFVQCSNDRHNVWQHIYSSQIYGTFFGVFIKFKFSGTTLRRVTLKVINYKGLVNIGFRKAEIKDDNGNTLKTGKTIVLDNYKGKFFSRGENNLLLIMNLGIVKKKKDFKHTLPKDNFANFNSKDYFHIIRVRQPLRNNKGKAVPEINGFFDEECFYRDGRLAKVKTANEISLEEAIKKLMSLALMTLMHLHRPLPLYAEMHLT